MRGGVPCSAGIHRRGGATPVFSTPAPAASSPTSAELSNAKIVFRAPEGGTYRVLATSFGIEETGTYTLTVRKQLDAQPQR